MIEMPIRTQMNPPIALQPIERTDYFC